jgi:ABC-type sugar transport system ATPase subunit
MLAAHAERGVLAAPGLLAGKGADYAANGISKSFGGVTVLRDVTVRFSPGEVHSLIGENGAGKSTLLKVMAGLYPADAGELVLDGKPLPPLSPRDAQRHGIYLVPQEPRLMPDLSVAENLYLGALPTTRSGRVDWRLMNDTTGELVAAVGLRTDPRVPAGRLSLAQQQLLECARALSRGCGTIFFDEPTSPLTAHDAERLFDVMRQLREAGLTLAFISHRLDEIEAVSDRITVLRDGAVVARAERGGWTRQGLVTAMIGRELIVTRRARPSGAAGSPVAAPGSQPTAAGSTETTAGQSLSAAAAAGPEPPPAAPGAVVLEVTDLFSPPEVNGMSVRVRAGEIVGLAGLVGSGRTEFAETLFGIRHTAGGRATVNGRDITGASPRRCIDAGLIYLAEDRGRHGIFADVDITRNATSAITGRLPKVARTLLRPWQEQELARTAAQEMDVRAASLGAPMKTLSGGNQQKALLARWMLAKPIVAIFDEPTRGVDIGAKESIYAIIESLAASGLAALVISSELEELVRLCDRVYAVYEGRVTGELAGDAITLEALGQLAVGA